MICLFLNKHLFLRFLSMDLKLFVWFTITVQLLQPAHFYICMMLVSLLIVPSSSSITVEIEQDPEGSRPDEGSGESIRTLVAMS